MHHFIQDSYEKKHIQVLKIHTDDNVADLLTKAFDVSSAAGFSLYCWMKLCTSSTIVDAAELINSVKQIHVIVDGMVVVISESSVRSDLLFNDEDEPFNDTYETPKHSKKVFTNMARKSINFSEKVTPLFDSMLVQNQTHEGEGSTIPTEPQHTPSTSQPTILATQTAPLQTATHPTVSHGLQTDPHIKQILPSLSTYQRKHRKTHKPRKSKKVTELPQNSVPLDIRADEVTDPGAKKLHLRGADAQTRFETASKRSNDPPLSTSHTVESGEDRMEQETDLTDFIPPTPYDSPLSGGHIPKVMREAKTTQDKVITRFKLRVRRLEKKRKTRTLQPMKRRLFKGRVETSTDKRLGEDASKQGKNDGQIEDLNLTNGADTEVIVEDKVNSVKQIHAIVDGMVVVISESSVRSDLLFNDEDDAQTRFETASKRSNDPPLSTSHTVESGEDRMEQETDLTDFIPPTPYDSRLSGGHTPKVMREAKTTQDKVITRFKLRVRRLEKKRKTRTLQPMKRRLFKGRVKTSTDKRLGEDASKQGKNDGQIEDLNLINGADTEVIVEDKEVIIEDKGSGEKGGSKAETVSTARPNISAARPEVSTTKAKTPPTTTTLFDNKDVTIADTLVKMKSQKARKRSSFQRC
nr:putative ribonuclease H-like domain-containing protein [Tanacetum cinerariifolium]